MNRGPLQGTTVPLLPERMQLPLVGTRAYF